MKIKPESEKNEKNIIAGQSGAALGETGGLDSANFFYGEYGEYGEYGRPCRTLENQDFHSAFLFRCRSCIMRSPYPPFSEMIPV